MQQTSVSMRPAPKDEGVRLRMSRQRTRDTKPELELRRNLHRRGLRFRVDRRPFAGIRCRADIVFGPAKVAVFVDGCFWHGCTEHGAVPKNNREWWVEKLQLNQARDARTDATLEEHGWRSIRVWEHEDLGAAADLVESIVRARRPG